MLRLWIVGAAVGLAGCGLGPSPHVPRRADCDLVAAIATKPGTSVDLPEKRGQAPAVASSLDLLMGPILLPSSPRIASSSTMRGAARLRLGRLRVRSTARFL